MAGWRLTATSSSTWTTVQVDRRAPTRYVSKNAPALRKSSSDRRPRHGAPHRGERPAARAGRRGDADRGRDRSSGRPGPATTPPSAPVAPRGGGTDRGAGQTSAWLPPKGENHGPLAVLPCKSAVSWGQEWGP